MRSHPRDPPGVDLGLVDVGIDREPLDHAPYPHTDPRDAPLDLTAAANKTAFHDEHGKCHSVAEV